MYARTNNNVVNLDDYHRVDYLNGKPYSHNKTGTLIYPQEIIKHADKLEDLCDEFVSVRDEYHDVWATLNEAVCLCSESNIYGAIWIDTGLKYVAKYKDNKLETL